MSSLQRRRDPSSARGIQGQEAARPDQLRHTRTAVEGAHGQAWELLKAMAGQGPLTIRAVARRVAREVKAVHGDAHALIDVGFLDKTAKSQVVFPVRGHPVEFTLRAA